MKKSQTQHVAKFLKYFEFLTEFHSLEHDGYRIETNSTQKFMKTRIATSDSQVLLYSIVNIAFYVLHISVIKTC